MVFSVVPFLEIFHEQIVEKVGNDICEKMFHDPTAKYFLNWKQVPIRRGLVK